MLLALMLRTTMEDKKDRHGLVTAGVGCKAAHSREVRPSFLARPSERYLAASASRLQNCILHKGGSSASAGANALDIMWRLEGVNALERNAEMKGK